MISTAQTRGICQRTSVRVPRSTDEAIMIEVRMIRNKLFIWKKEEKPRPQTTAAAVDDAKGFASLTVPKISDSKLKDLSWSLDIKESIYSNKNQK